MHSDTRFNVTLIDPDGYKFAHFLHYFSRLIANGLESLGYDTIMTRNHFTPDRTTIVVGAHLVFHSETADRIANNGPYIVLQTERIKTHRTTFWSNGSFESVYIPFMNRAQATWEVLPDQIETLNELGVRAELFLGGYEPALDEIRRKKNKDIDFMFYGSPHTHRTELFEKLTSRGHTLVNLFDDHAIFRNDLIARTRVNLCTADAHFPWPRVCYLLNNQALVVVEKCADAEWLEDCFESAPTDQWVDVCEHALLRKDRQEVTDAYFERYRSRPFKNILEVLLSKVGLT